MEDTENFDHNAKKWWSSSQLDAGNKTHQQEPATNPARPSAVKLAERTLACRDILTAPRLLLFNQKAGSDPPPAVSPVNRPPAGNTAVPTGPNSPASATKLPRLGVKSKGRPAVPRQSPKNRVNDGRHLSDGQSKEKAGPPAGQGGLSTLHSGKESWPAERTSSIRTASAAVGGRESGGTVRKQLPGLIPLASATLL
jgi:hypothetical protein